MSTFRRLDRRLLSLCTKLAHGFQLLTGKTNFFIAKMGILFASIDVTLGIAGYFHPFPHHRKSMFDVIVGIIYLPIIAVRTLKLDEADKRAEESTEKTAVPGITGESSFGVRMLWLYFALWDTMYIFEDIKRPGYNLIDVLLTVSFSYGLLTFYYFVEVEPLRPQKSLVRKLVEKLSFTTAQPVPVESKG